jgi:hypothetical protein
MTLMLTIENLFMTFWVNLILVKVKIYILNLIKIFKNLKIFHFKIINPFMVSTIL